MAQTWQRKFRERLHPQVLAEHARQKAMRPKRRGRPKRIVVTGYLIFDDSVHTKRKGRVMAGLGDSGYV